MNRAETPEQPPAPQKRRIFAGEDSSVYHPSSVSVEAVPRVVLLDHTGRPLGRRIGYKP